MRPKRKYRYVLFPSGPEWYQDGRWTPTPNPDRHARVFSYPRTIVSAKRQANAILGRNPGDTVWLERVSLDGRLIGLILFTG